MSVPLIAAALLSVSSPTTQGMQVPVPTPVDSKLVLVAPCPAETIPEKLAPSANEVAPAAKAANAPPEPVAPSTPAASIPDQNDTQSEIVVQGRQKAPPGDPLQAVNAQSYAVTQSIDKAIVGPVSLGFAKIVPTPIRRGLHNFLANLNEPIVFVNFLLQFKIGKAAETLARFTINSTIGVGGLMDIAKRKPFYLPERRNSLSDTLGFYGVKPGPFFYLPLVGPTTLRDVIGNTIDRLLLPTTIGKPFNQVTFTAPASLGSALDYRAGFDKKLTEIREASDPYTAAREHYLQGRQAEIDELRGKHSNISKTPDPTVTPAPSPLCQKAPSPITPASSPPQPAPGATTGP